MYKGKKGPPSHMPDISEGKEMQQQGLQAIPNSVIDNNVRSPSVSAGLRVGKRAWNALLHACVRVSLPSDCQVVTLVCMLCSFKLSYVPAAGANGMMISPVHMGIPGVCMLRWFLLTTIAPLPLP